MKNVAAYTKPEGSYPEYISFNRTDEGDMSVTVRSPPTNGAEGSQATIVVPAEEWQRMMGV